MTSWEELNQYFRYDPETGNIYWKINPPGKITYLVGCRVGTLNTNGYLFFRFKRKHYLVHRVAWMLVNKEWPKNLIDHINGDKTDNRLTNLRAANCSQNKANAVKYKCNTSGFKGVQKDRNKWRAGIRHNGKFHSLGSYSCKKEAARAYNRAALLFFGEFALLNDV